MCGAVTGSRRTSSVGSCYHHHRRLWRDYQVHRAGFFGWWADVFAVAAVAAGAVRGVAEVGNGFQGFPEPFLKGGISRGHGARQRLKTPLHVPHHQPLLKSSISVLALLRLGNYCCSSIPELSADIQKCLVTC